MKKHIFDHDFCITPDQKMQFQRDGFVKLEGFLNEAVVDMLLERLEVEMHRNTVDNFMDSLFHRSKYDFESDKNDIFELLERRYFRQALTDLAELDLFLTFELCFEIEKNIDKGFPWHVGVQSFGYQCTEEFGCTLWVPLHPIDTKDQRGEWLTCPAT